LYWHGVEKTRGYHIVPWMALRKQTMLEVALRSAYNLRLSPHAGTVMEAERINAVANRIADLTGRGEQLRRYL
jgi:hypothetical protein